MSAAMYTLGINAAFHDSSACLVRDGAVVAAAEEERFTQIKHGKRPVPFSVWELPYHAIDYCLAEAGIAIDAVDHVAYSFDPALMVNGSGMPSRIELPLEPSALAKGNCERRGIRCSCRTSSMRRVNSPAVRRITCSGGCLRTTVPAGNGITCRTISRTRRAHSSPLRSTSAPC